EEIAILRKLRDLPGFEPLRPVCARRLRKTLWHLALRDLAAPGRTPPRPAARLALPARIAFAPLPDPPPPLSPLTPGPPPPPPSPLPPSATPPSASPALPSAPSARPSPTPAPDPPQPARAARDPLGASAVTWDRLPLRAPPCAPAVPPDAVFPDALQALRPP